MLRCFVESRRLPGVLLEGRRQRVLVPEGGVKNWCVEDVVENMAIRGTDTEMSNIAG